MDNQKLKIAIRKGLQAAAGKSIEEAVETMMIYLDAYLGILEQPTPAHSSVPPASPVNYANPIDDLPPIDSQPIEKKDANKVRIWWDAQTLYQKVISNTSAEIFVDVSGNKLKLLRTVQIMNGDIDGVSLAYIPEQRGDNMPYPKESFWCSDEHVDIYKAMVKITSDAQKMYQPRKGPIRQMIPLEQPTAFRIGGDV